MSFQLPTILSPPARCTPVPAHTVSPQLRPRSCRTPFPGRLPSWTSPLPRRLVNASGRIEFIIFLFMDWLFASGCPPPRLSTTQLPSATDSQCPVRRGLSPRCWCALSGARGRPVPRRREPDGTMFCSCGAATNVGICRSDGIPVTSID